MVQDQRSWVEKQRILVPTSCLYGLCPLSCSFGMLKRHFAVDGQVANVTLPSNIAPGNYIIRHEIIALHLGDEQGGAEFYPSCSQLHMSGSGTGAPTPAELVKFPGAYDDSDPGIFVPDVSIFVYYYEIQRSNFIIIRFSTTISPIIHSLDHLWLPLSHLARRARGIHRAKHRHHQSLH
jgi:hypothetical protein